LERGTHWYYERARGSYSDDKAAQGTPARRREWEGQNPAGQQFTKTDLAKFEHSWLGVPHLVCMGAEKNFMRFAETMDSESGPAVDQNYFRRLIAKAILFRTAEKLFSTQDLAGYRANSVAYAVGWLAVRSGWRINLDRIWDSQRLSPALCDALKIACTAAHAHILVQPGNSGEASKREQCWKDFKTSEIPVGGAWLGELVASPFLIPTSEDDMLAHEWESVRHQFQNDARTVGELEAMTGRSWVASRREETIGSYAGRSWDELCRLRGVGAKKLRTLVEIFAAAAGR
jgi:hypothetical protein